MIGHPMRWRTWADLHREEMQRRRREQVERITLLASGAAVMLFGGFVLWM